MDKECTSLGNCDKIRDLVSQQRILMTSVRISEDGKMKFKEIILWKGLKPKITEQRESLLSKYRGWNGYIYDDDKCGYSGTDKNKLKITSMSGKLQGTYQCVVSNDVDSVKSDEILLTMEKEQSIKEERMKFI